MEKNDIIKYATKTPHNTNPAVLDSMINELLAAQPVPTPSEDVWIEWDGSIEGRAKIDMSDGTMFTYKVSDKILTAADLNKVYLVQYDDGTHYMTKLESEDATDLDGAILFNGEFACVSGHAGEYHSEDWTLTVPEDGTYFPIMNEYFYVSMLIKH